MCPKQTGCGQSGSLALPAVGKSTLWPKWRSRRMRRRFTGSFVVDSQGRWSTDILARCAEAPTTRVVVLDPAERDVVSGKPPARRRIGRECRERVVDNVRRHLQQVWKGSFGRPHGFFPPDVLRKAC